METFSALPAIGAGNSPLPGEFPAQSPETRSYDVFFDLRLNKRLCKQSWGWWFEMLLRPLWGHCNVIGMCSAGVSSDVIDALPSQLIYRQQAAAVPVFSWQTIDYNPSGLNNCFQAITIATTNHYVQMQSLYTCSVMRFLEILSAILNDIMLSKKVARNHL